MTLRIGLVTSEFPPDLGGVETYAWQLAKELGRRPNLQVSVYAPHKSAGIAPPPGVTIKPILTSCMELDWAKLKNEPVDVWHALSACHAWIAQKNRPAVVSVHGNDFLAPYPLTACPSLKLPGLWPLRPWIWHNLRPLWRYATRRMLARALPKATAIFANSHYTAEVLLKKYPACRAKTHIAHVGVDPVFFDDPRALATLKDRFEFEYTIAGDGLLRPKLEQLANVLGIGARVRFVGGVSDAELRDLYAHADLFVLTASIVPRSHEGFGIVYLEAAASGVASLAARLAGAAEAVADGRSGFFIDTPAIPSISDALARFLAGEIHIDANSCRDFAHRFNWERVADACEAAYREVPVRESRP